MRVGRPTDFAMRAADFTHFAYLMVVLWQREHFIVGLVCDDGRPFSTRKIRAKKNFGNFYPVADNIILYILFPLTLA